MSYDRSNEDFEQHRDSDRSWIMSRRCPVCGEHWLYESLPSRFACGRLTNGKGGEISRECLAKEAELNKEL